jgi:hypothetical protein
MANAFRKMVKAEISRCDDKDYCLHSLHEAFGLLLEEVEEFKAEVWKKREERDYYNILRELAQIAAIAERTAWEIGECQESLEELG